MKKNLILYDLDGTLVDTSGDIVEAMNHLFRELGAHPLPPREIIKAVGIGVRELVSKCLNTHDPKTLEKAVTIYRAYYAEHLLDKSHLYPGAVEVLEFFKARRQAVLTNKPNPFSRQILEGLKVAHYFSDIVAGDTDYPRKPDPTAIFSLMKKAGVGCDETLFIGDSPIDVEAGRNAEVQTVVVRHGFADEQALDACNPQIMIGSFEELIGLAKKEAW